MHEGEQSGARVSGQIVYAERDQTPRDRATQALHYELTVGLDGEAVLFFRAVGAGRPQGGRPQRGVSQRLTDHDVAIQLRLELLACAVEQVVPSQHGVVPAQAAQRQGSSETRGRQVGEHEEEECGSVAEDVPVASRASARARDPPSTMGGRAEHRAARHNWRTCSHGLSTGTSGGNTPTTTAARHQGYRNGAYNQRETHDQPSWQTVQVDKVGGLGDAVEGLDQPTGASLHLGHVDLSRAL